MPDAFENIFGQPRVRDFLRTSVKGGVSRTPTCSSVPPFQQDHGGVRSRSGPHVPERPLTVRAEGSAARAMHAGASCARSTPTCTIMLRRA